VLVVNRHSGDLERAKVNIAVASIEAKLKRTALGIVPMDERRILYSVNRGISVVARDRNQSPAKELVALADALYNNVRPMPDDIEPVAQQPAKQPTSRLSKLFGG
ncbi:MAG: hypothetical protein IT323_01280, partial [Anaerolineae bacterium]|nr:hypothetical protein [Anaerolineae bacterium]